MRKLSELYQVVLDNYPHERSNYICDNIMFLERNMAITKSERDLVDDHFCNGKHKHPIRKRGYQWWSIKNTKIRIAYLEYLIKLCKEQDI